MKLKRPPAGRAGETAGERPSGKGLRTFSTPLTLVALIVLMLVAHFPLRTSDYIQDDHLAYEENAIVKRGDVGEILSTTYWEGAEGQDRSLYRPWVILSFAAEYGLFGQPVSGFSHLVNLVAHAAVIALLWLLILRLGGRYWEATAAAGLFAVHPLHVEAVGGIVGRAELFAAGGGLLALLAMTMADPWEQRGRARRWSWIAAGGLLLALGSKEVAIAIPPLMALLMLWRVPQTALPAKERWLGRVGMLIPGAIAGLVYIGLRTRALGAWVVTQPVHPVDNLIVDLHGMERLATALSLATRYLRLLLAPIDQSADYSGPVLPIVSSPFAPDALLGAILLAIVALVAVAGALSGRSIPPQPGPQLPWLRRLGFAALLFLLPYMIIGNLLFAVGAGIAERFMYLPSAGFCAAAGLLLGKIEAGDLPYVRFPRATCTRFMVAILGLWIAAFGLLNYQRCMLWQNDQTLFTAAASAYPKSPRAHYILGKLAAEREEYSVALDHLQRTVELYPGHFSAWQEQGTIHGKLGRPVQAERMFREALELNPMSYRNHFNMALIRRKQRDLEGAELALRKALAWNPRAPNTWAELGNLMLQRRRFDRAAGAYRRAIALGRDDLAPRLKLAEDAAVGG